MDNTLSFLITMVCISHDHTYLSKVALKVKRENISEDTALYPLEPSSKKELFGLLPEHVQSMGEIVAVESIFEVVCD